MGVSPDPLDALIEWKEKENLPFDLLSDPEHQVLAAWGAWGERSMYGKTYMGVIRSHWVIDENGIILDEQLKISPDKSVVLAVEVVTSA